MSPTAESSRRVRDEAAAPTATGVAPMPARSAPTVATPAPAPTPTKPAPGPGGRRSTARLIVIGLVMLAIGGIAYALRPTPITIEASSATVGPMRVTIDADAVTRVRQPFMVAAPVGGLVRRLTVNVGDVVRAGDPIAWISAPPVYSTEQRAVGARVDAAVAGQLQFDARLSQAELSLAQALRDEARAKRLVEAGAMAERDLELATLTVVTRRADVGTVRAQRRIAVAEVAQARAARDAAIGQGAATTIVRAPTGGRVLAIPQRSARVVAAGSPLLELGDPGALDVAADVLSSDAASIRAGQRVILSGWGGSPLTGIVRVVEPSARTRISALGVEEQRLTVVIDPSLPPNTLGDGYRLDASIVVWEGRALTIPASALMRTGDRWAVYVVRDGRAARQAVEIGHVGSGAAEVRNGLKSGERVVLFPSDALRDGSRIREAP